MKKYLSENAIKDRLKNLALEQKREFNKLLKQLYLERFLARLAHYSSYIPLTRRDLVISLFY